MLKLSSFQLKVFAMIFMVMDHLYTYLNLKGGIDIPIWFGYIGKISAPIFFYLIVEGFFHTRNRKKYMVRLFSFGVLMVGFDLLLGINNNIFLSLGLSVALMTAIEFGKKSERYGLSSVLAIGIGLLGMLTEASIYGVIMTLIFYFLREKKGWMVFTFILCSILPVFGAISMGSYFLESIFIWDYQWMMILSIPFILLYSGELGLKNKFTKWMFYLFYPLHLIVIILLSKYIGS